MVEAFKGKKKMKIAILGSKGMLGVDVVTIFSQINSFEVYEAADIDITDMKSVQKLREISPDVIINCAAYTLVDKSEENQEESYAVNALGPKNIAEYCKNNNAVMIQISTDYVFDGTQDQYTEGDKRNPINWYGKSKADAEKFVSEQLDDYFIVRTSWLFGHAGPNFVKTVIEKTQKEGKMKVVNDQFGCPTYTKDLVEALAELLIQNYKYGIYHITNTQPTNWFNFACDIIKLKEIKAEIIPCKTQEFPRPAKRPARSILANTKGPSMRTYKEALRGYIQDERSHISRRNRQ